MGSDNTQKRIERIKRKTSHVDWWLYKDAAPYEEFELIADFEKYFHNIREMEKNEKIY